MRGTVTVQCILLFARLHSPHALSLHMLSRPPSALHYHAQRQPTPYRCYYIQGGQKAISAIAKAGHQVVTSGIGGYYIASQKRYLSPNPALLIPLS
jgi:hypothetical protein